MGKLIARLERTPVLARLPRRLARMLTTSTLSTAVDLAVLFVCLGALALRPGPAATIGCLAGGLVSFWLCRRYVFFGARGSALRQGLAYGTLVVLGGALWSGAIVHLATGHLGAPVLVAKATAALVVMVGWNWPVSAKVVFARRAA